MSVWPLAGLLACDLCLFLMYLTDFVPQQWLKPLIILIWQDTCFCLKTYVFVSRHMCCVKTRVWCQNMLFTFSSLTYVVCSSNLRFTPLASILSRNLTRYKLLKKTRNIRPSGSNTMSIRTETHNPNNIDGTDRTNKGDTWVNLLLALLSGITYGGVVA